MAPGLGVASSCCLSDAALPLLNLRMRTVSPPSDFVTETFGIGVSVRLTANSSVIPCGCLTFTRITESTGPTNASRNASNDFPLAGRPSSPSNSAPELMPAASAGPPSDG